MRLIGVSKLNMSCRRIQFNLSARVRAQAHGTYWSCLERSVLKGKMGRARCLSRLLLIVILEQLSRARRTEFFLELLPAEIGKPRGV